MAFLAEKPRGFKGLLSREYGYTHMVLDQDFPLDLPSGHVMFQATPGDTQSWLAWFNTVPIIPGQMGIALNEGFSAPAGDPLSDEHGVQIILTGGAEFCFEDVVFDLTIGATNFIATPAEIEAVEDALRQQGVLLRGNTHNLQNSTT